MPGGLAPHRRTRDRSPDQDGQDVVVEDDLVEDEAMDVTEDESGQERVRTVRSTRRIGGFPDLPTVPMDARTAGRAFMDPRTRRVFQPSMFVTLTLPSYGKVVPGRGVPVDPSRYDYRRAALDALPVSAVAGPVLAEPRPLRGVQGAVLLRGRGATPAGAARARGGAGRDPAGHDQGCRQGDVPTRRGGPSVERVVYEGEQRPVWDEGRRGYVDPVDGGDAADLGRGRPPLLG